MNTEIYIPVLDGRVLKNAIGSDQNEVDANLSLIELTDEENNRIVTKRGHFVIESD